MTFRATISQKFLRGKVNGHLNGDLGPAAELVGMRRGKSFFSRSRNFRNDSGKKRPYDDATTERENIGPGQFFCLGGFPLSPAKLMPITFVTRGRQAKVRLFWTKSRDRQFS